ncbi:MAG TPA: HAMP domain-containing sensor histidine kinase [Thermoanaerobaculia bacterium]|nr:HAMP domain-containing sensor histidine kinase [Thermoanaerobaculia bacterium]
MTSPRTLAAAFGLFVGGAALLFWLFERQLSRTWLAFGLHPEIVRSIDRSLEDQKTLARLDSEQAAGHRARFEELRALKARLQVLAHNREALARRFDFALVGLFVASAAGAVGASLWRQGRQERRLARLESGVAALAAGESDLDLGLPRRDLIGRIAAMIERTSRSVARDRRRLASLEHLSAWQEAARRQAHELRTPLTAARLELDRLRGLVADEQDPARGEELGRFEEGLRHEVERLAAFASSFASFGRLPRPELRGADLVELARGFTERFAAAWPGLTLAFEPGELTPLPVEVDPDLIQQVLVNLCENAARAVAPRGSGRVTFRTGATGRFVALEVGDDGPGVPPELAPRLFQPYVGSRVGGGMGLGLAISRKILLDHGGDLELAATSAAGATFRLLLPAAGGDAA